MNKILPIIKNTIKYINNTAQDSINIGYGIDKNCIRCTGSSIASIRINNPHKAFTFHIIFRGVISKSEQLNFNKLSRIYNINILIYELNLTAIQSKYLPTRTAFPVSVYFIIILPLIIKDVSKLYYIDSDIICINSADDLFNITLNNNIIAAVPEENNYTKNWCSSLGLSNHKYFNSGLLIIDVDKWLAADIFNKTLSNIKKHPDKIFYPDQDALNMTLTGNIKYIDEKFNCFNWSYWKTHAPKKLCHSNIVFIHFGSYPKPWGLAWPSSEYYNSFNANIYSSYEALTPWKDYPLEKPKYYKEMKRYAKYLLKKGDIVHSIKWYINYSIEKISKKI